MSDHLKGPGYDLKYHYFPINISRDLIGKRAAVPIKAKKPGEQMNALDRPITLRELSEWTESRKAAKKPTTLGAFVREALHKARKTDFVKVRFAGKMVDHTIRIVNQPTRRVQVGDLVTMAPNGWVAQPQVVRVREIDVPAPAMLKASAVGVAISPEDAERIEAVLGRVR